MEYLDHTQRIRFPSPGNANPWGMVAQGGNLSPGILMSAYEQGIFPWYDEPPIVWFSPDPRFVLYLDRFRLGKRLRRSLKSSSFVITFDQDFPAVIHRCRTTRLDGEGTWITTDMEQGYRELHRLGVAHSVEVWERGVLVGGLYGVATGALFAGESMFTAADNAGKAALVALVGLLDSWSMPAIDCQSYTDNLARFGAVDIPRERFLEELAQHRAAPGIPQDWRNEDAAAAFQRGMQLGAAHQ